MEQTDSLATDVVRLWLKNSVFYESDVRRAPEHEQMPKKNGPKLYGSSEGRFSIIDELAKDSSESDVDSPLPTYPSGKLFNQRFVRSTFSQSVDSRCLQAKATASTTPSRFRIVPLESKYKRGRWNCFDYYDKESQPKPAKARAPDTTTTGQISSSSGRSVRSLNSGYSLQGTTHSGNTTAPFDGSSESDRENNEVFARSTPAFSRTSATPPHQESNFTPNDAVSVLNNKKGPERHHIRRAADERLQRGLESSLTPHEIRNRINPTKRSDLLAGAVGSNNGMGQPSTSAIDSKIEQAMDLVKTHLMFAVREELDVLRGKITELESHIYRLETENAVFKANIPSDVLRNLSLDQSN
nr:TSC-22 Dip Bun domain containing protein [Haemonchus contortus]